MTRQDILEVVSPLPAMRRTVDRIVDQAAPDRDRLSFLDGQKVYLEIGQSEVGSGYITWDPLDGWKAMIRQREGWRHEPCVEHELCTFREALDVFMERQRVYLEINALRERRVEGK